MAGNVYITALQPGSGKSAVVLGLTEVLARQAGRLAFYRPFIASAEPPDPDIELIRSRFRLPQSYVESYALTSQDIHDVDARNHDVLVKRILDGYATVASGADVVVVEGSDFTEASLGLELALNLEAANTWGAPYCSSSGAERARPSRCSMRCVRISAFWSSAAAPCSG
jgi:phosphate acetyltransferase